jgi:uncharacterized damage-inducible protein DinB
MGTEPLATVFIGDEGMIESPLLPAVQRLARSVRDMPDVALERSFTWRGQTREIDVRWALFAVYTDLCDLAATLAVERSISGPPVMEAQRALAQAHAAYRDLQALLLAADALDLDRRPAEGEWPLRTVLGHMLRTETIFIATLQWAIDGARQGKDARPFPDEREAQIARPDSSGDLAAIVARFDASHAEVAEQFAALQADDLAAPFLWWFSADVRFQLFRFDAHLREHTIQIAKLLEALAPPPSDALRTLRLTYGALAEAEGWLIGAPGLATAQLAATAARITAAADAFAALPRAT